MIIDFHTHTFPDNIAKTTIPKLAKAGNIMYFSDGTKNELISSLKEAQIDYSVVVPIATKPSQSETINAIAAKTNETSDKTGIISFGSVHPDNDNYKEIIKQAYELGIKGIKLHPYYQQFVPDDERIIRIVDTIENYGMMTIFHAGLDIGFDDENLGSPIAFRKLYDTIQPKNLILAHMGGWRSWDEVEEYLVGLPIYFDLSFSLGKIISYVENSRNDEESKQMSDEQFHRMVKNHGADKILFGTDSPWNNQKDYLSYVRNIGLSKDELKMILGDNAKKLLNL